MSYCPLRAEVSTWGWLVAAVLVWGVFLNTPAESSTQWGKPVKTVSLPVVVQETLREYFQKEKKNQKLLPNQAFWRQWAKQFKVANGESEPSGVFVTLSHHGKPRACWGNVYPAYPNAVEATVFATLGALTKEYRYPPIQAREVETLTPQVTLIRRMTSMSTLKGYNPLKTGILVRSGSRYGVMLPGESKDGTYQLVQAKLKAGIQPGEPYQMFRLDADVYP